jgi:hypothetical protein
VKTSAAAIADLFAPLVSHPNADAGDHTVTCSGCDEERDDPHTWEDCAQRLREQLAHFRDLAIERERDVARGIATGVSPEERWAALSVEERWALSELLMTADVPCGPWQRQNSAQWVRRNGRDEVSAEVERLRGSPVWSCVVHGFAVAAGDSARQAMERCDDYLRRHDCSFVGGVPEIAE